MNRTARRRQARRFWTLGGKTGDAVSEQGYREQDERLARTRAQVVLRWALQHRALVIPKSSHENRMAFERRLFDVELTDADMQARGALDRTNQSARARG